MLRILTIPVVLQNLDTHMKTTARLDAVLIAGPDKRIHSESRMPVPWNTRKVARSPFRTLARAKKAERNFWANKSIGFTARSSLKSMGRIPRASGNYVLGKKYTLKRRW